MENSSYVLLLNKLSYFLLFFFFLSNTVAFIWEGGGEDTSVKVYWVCLCEELHLSECKPALTVVFLTWGRTEFSLHFPLFLHFTLHC